MTDVRVLVRDEHVARAGCAASARSDSPSSRSAGTAPAPGRAGSAARSCSSLTVGSSRICSSPTSAAAIAARMPAVGRVTVSERRSITAAHCACCAAPVVRSTGDRDRRRRVDAGEGGACSTGSTRRHSRHARARRARVDAPRGRSPSTGPGMIAPIDRRSTVVRRPKRCSGRPSRPWREMQPARVERVVVESPARARRSSRTPATRS